MVNTPQYELGKYLDKVIKKVIPDKYMLKSTDDFLTKLNSCNLNASRCCLVSFDVESLFTNVPLKEVIKLASRYVYESDDKPSYDRAHFEKLLEYATSSLFIYRDKVYKQVDGVAMGSPLGPTLANLFMAHLEKEWMKEKFSPKLYFRYVDDIFCLFDSSSDDYKDFHNFLNTRHSNLKFTIEQNTSSIPFLDVNVEKSGDNFMTSVFRKKTTTNLLLNFQAYAPFIYKKALVNCFVKRAFKICSSWRLFDVEINKLGDIFSNNGFPKILFEKVVKKVVNNNNPHKNDERKQKNVATVHTLVLPYFGKVSDTFRRKIDAMSRKLNIEVRTVFRPFKISNYFSLKAKCPDSLKSMLVYRYRCPKNGGTTYIGRTKRHFLVRMKEHMTASQSPSAIFNHVIDCDCSASKENFEIIYKAKNTYELNIAEALLISNYKPDLNRNLANNGASLFLKLFLI